MSLSFCVLGSGSGGNCTLVMCGEDDCCACLLIDCGFSPRATNRKLAAFGLTIADIGAIMLTHFDTDHFYPGWLKVIDRFAIPMFVHRQHRSMAWRCGLNARQVTLYSGNDALELGLGARPIRRAETKSHLVNAAAANPAAPEFADRNGAIDKSTQHALRVQTMLVAHDNLGTVSFVVEHQGRRLGYATDLGHVPATLFDHFADVHALAIESNYDRQMQLDSGRPVFLKRRIMGGAGHLSNEQSLAAVHEIAEQSCLSHVALLHLSRECNDPNLVRQLYRAHAPHLVDRVTITDQFEPSPLIEVKIGERAQAGKLLWSDHPAGFVRQRDAKQMKLWA